MLRQAQCKGGAPQGGVPTCENPMIPSKGPCRRNASCSCASVRSHLRPMGSHGSCSMRLKAQHEAQGFLWGARD